MTQETMFRIAFAFLLVAMFAMRLYLRKKNIICEEVCASNPAQRR